MTYEQTREQILRGNYYERIIKPLAVHQNAVEQAKVHRNSQMATHRRPGYKPPACAELPITREDYDEILGADDVA